MRPAPRLASIVPVLALTFDTAAGTVASGDRLPGSSGSLIASGISEATGMVDLAVTRDPNHGNKSTRLARFASALAMASPGLPAAYVWRRTNFNRPGIANS
jgi:sugar (pentulose or hexulose) kinase